MAQSNTALVDIRYNARGRRPEWNSERLRERYGVRYKPLSCLGNKNYKGGPIQIANPERGIPLLVDALQRGWTLILLCACAEYEQCHRKVVTEMVKAACLGVEVRMEADEGSGGTSLRALSIAQPWTFLLSHGYKDVENRDWTTRYRGPVLLHAGQKMDEDFFLDQGLHYPTWKRLPCGLPDNAPAYKRDYERGGIVGIATLVDVVEYSTSPWFRGAYGFVFENARPLPFVKVRGSLGLFSVPDGILPADLLEVRS
jgi:hypothetical protein